MASKCHKYVLLPAGYHEDADMAKFMERWNLEPIALDETFFVNVVWNRAMKSYVRRPRGYLHTRAVYVGLAKTPLTAKKACDQFVQWLRNCGYSMKPNASQWLIMDRDPKHELPTK